MFLRISMTKGVIRFGIRGKLSPRYIGPFEILESVGEIAYRLALPPSLKGVHNVVYVSQLRRDVRDESQMLDHSELELQLDLSYTEQPIVSDYSVSSGIMELAYSGRNNLKVRRRHPLALSPSFRILSW